MRIVKVDSVEDVRVIHEGAAELVDGHDVPSTGVRQARLGRLERLFDGQPTNVVPSPELVFAAVDDATGDVFGGIILESWPSPELMARNVERARNTTRVHRTLSALFVVTSGRGLGRALVGAASHAALAEGARYVDGFVDDRNQSAGFYRAIGFHVMPHNTGLPARSPTNVVEQHVPGVNGHWFYDDLWRRFEHLMRCERCRGPLTFSVAEDRVVCEACRTASST